MKIEEDLEILLSVDKVNHFFKQIIYISKGGKCLIHNFV